MDVIQKNLLDKALNNSLGHFFILNPPGRAKGAKKELMKWSELLLQSYFASTSEANGQKTASKNLKNNEDVLIIDEELVNKKFYDKSFVQKISQFFSYRPVKTNRKFVIIEDLEKMSVIHSNKLLKIFEEPPVNATIFLLNPSLLKVLPTIASRAVFIRVALKAQGLNSDLGLWSKKLEKKNLHQFCEYFKNRHEDEKDLARAVMDKIDEGTQTSLIKKAERYLKEQSEDALYNHNNYARLTLLKEIFTELAE
ncbi:MAG: hypothetical protein WD025_03300 [Bacteriovoracaceae bacterium]